MAKKATKKATKEITLTKEEFKAIRLQLGETQEEFARRLGYENYRTILQKENGARPIMFRDEALLEAYIPVIRALNQAE